MTNILIGVLVLVWLLARQLQTRPVKEDSTLVFIGVLVVVGIAQTVAAMQKAHAHSLPTAAIAILLVGLALGAGLGAVRATTVKLWRDQTGVALRKGTGVTAVLWLVSIGLHFGLDALLDHTTTINDLGTATILIYLAVTLGVQREVVRARAAKLPGRPSSVWSPGFAA